MIKKLLYILLFLFCSYSYGQAIQMTTTSITDRWSPFNVVKSGMNLTWTVTNPLIGTITINENQPIFDFSANNGSDILITITSADGFNGLTVFDLRDRFNGVSVNGIPSQMFVKQIDLSVATNLVELSTQYNRLPSLYIGENQKIEKLNIRGSRQLTNGIDISNNPLLTQIIADVTALTTLDIRNNPLLTDLRLYNARLTSVALDKILIDLDRHGLSNGSLRITDQTTGQSITSASFVAYNNLIGKGWTIDAAEPNSPNLMKGAGIANDLNNLKKESTFSVFNLNDGLNINSNLEVKDVKVYDLLGRIIIASKPNKLSFYLDASFVRRGSILIIHVELMNGMALNKKFIKL